MFYLTADEEQASVSLPVETAVAVYISYADTMRVLGATDMVIGVDDAIKQNTVYQPEFSNLPSVGSRFSMNVEQILSLNPDIVFTGTSYWYTPGLEDKLAANGTDIDVVRIASGEYSNTCSSILTMGYILGLVDNAIKYEEWHNEIIEKIGKEVSGLSEKDKISVYVDRPGHTTTAIGSGFAEVIEMTGVINLASELDEPYPVTSTEWVLERDPDLILGIAWIGSYGASSNSDLVARYNEITDEYKQASAVKNDRVFIIHSDLFAGPGYIVALAYLASWFYPDLFDDLDPQGLHQHYIDTFCGTLEYDVESQGAFVYGG